MMRFISGLNGFSLFYHIGKCKQIYALNMVGINAILYHIFNPNNVVIRYYDILFNMITILLIIICFNVPVSSYIYAILAINNWLKHKKQQILILDYNFYTRQIIHSYMVQLPLYLAICNIKN